MNNSFKLFDLEVSVVGDPTTFVCSHTLKRIVASVCMFLLRFYRYYQQSSGSLTKMIG